MKKALQAFQTSLSPDQAVVQTDNARIMAYSRPPGGNTTPPPSLDEITHRAIRWCMGHNLALWAVPHSRCRTLADIPAQPLLAPDLLK